MRALLDVFSRHGKIGRARYLATGLILLALKHNIDRLVAAYFGYPWSVFNYWVFKTPAGVENLTRQEANFYATLLVIALPFIWIGTVTTIRRLRDANLPAWLVVVFFLPFLNLLFFVVLSVIPSSESFERRPRTLSAKLGRLVPHSEFGSATLGIVLTTVLAVLLTALSTIGLGNYGWGVFVGIPFFLGLNSTLIYGFHQPRSIFKCLLVAGLSTVIVGLTLFAIAIEGVICLVMAFPIAIVLALFGGFIGFALQQRRTFAPQTLHVVSIATLLMPGLILLEQRIAQEPAVNAVKTSVVINAKRETVWANVVSFSPLTPPTDPIFKTGIAFPIRAEIDGRGVGAVRHCVFSTGEFVEPITIWDEPRLLAFDVTSQPNSMDELSIYSNLRPAHLQNYMLSHRGQFELKTLPDGTTLLEGTTWYQNRFWPGAYWRLWSDHIVHKIHMRVLVHIKSLAEER